MTGLQCWDALQSAAAHVVARVRATLALVLVLVALLVLWGWNHQHAKLVNSQRDAEGARLALGHQIVADQESKRQLQASVDDLLAQNADLRTAVETAKAASPGARPVAA